MRCSLSAGESWSIAFCNTSQTGTAIAHRCTPPACGTFKRPLIHSSRQARRLPAPWYQSLAGGIIPGAVHGAATLWAYASIVPTDTSSTSRIFRPGRQGFARPAGRKCRSRWKAPAPVPDSRNRSRRQQPERGGYALSPRRRPRRQTPRQPPSRARRLRRRAPTRRPP